MLDESLSLNSSELNEVRAATLIFLNAMACTGAEVVLIEFASTASIELGGYHEITNAFVATATTWLNTDYGTRTNGNFTSWEEAFEKVDALSVIPDIVIVFTDGVPTTYGSGSSLCSTGSPDDGPMVNGMINANKVKCEGSHVFTIFIGDNTINPQYLRNISGNTAYDPNSNNITNSDYTIQGQFSLLANYLSSFANQLCTYDSTADSDASCDNSNDGELTVTIPGPIAVQGYDYEISGPGGYFQSGFNETSTSLTFSNLSAGNYTIQVEITSADGSCVRTETIFETIEEGENPSCSISNKTDPSCDDEFSGSAQVNISDGNPPYDIDWGTGSAINQNSPYLITGLAAG
ncbi:MAG: VWA domain-containing protein, partial [Lewinella sp.]|nr:VWA domain-containing protein [Lewinella sp.]